MAAQAGRDVRCCNGVKTDGKGKTRLKFTFTHIIPRIVLPYTKVAWDFPLADWVVEKVVTVCLDLIQS